MDRALVTAEWPAAYVEELAGLGFAVDRAGWGATGRELPPAELAAAAAGATLLVTEIERVDAALLAAVPTLRLVATARGGPTNVDLAACASRGVPVLYTPGRNAESVADFTVGLLLALARGIAAADRHLRGEGWHVGGDLPYLHFRGPELAGRTLGLVGYGAVGRAVARRAVAGFGMRVGWHDPAVPGSVPLPELLSAADVVSVHCSRGPATAGLIGAAELALLQPSAYLLNTAGGGIVDEAALADALAGGRLAGAALDVFATEPLPRDSPLLTAPRLLLTPHLAGASDDVPAHHAATICADVARWRRGEPLEHVARP